MICISKRDSNEYNKTSYPVNLPMRKMYHCGVIIYTLYRAEKMVGT
jgi:hypothetical protein